MLQQDLEMSAQVKLYYDLFVPADAPPRAPLLLAVHGYGAHKRYMMREAEAVAPEGFVIASVQAPYQHFRQTKSGYRVGFGWLTDFRAAESVRLHHQFLLDVIARLDADEIIDPSRVFLFGFSQACALNFRFAFTHPEVPRGVIGVCGGIPGDLGESELYSPTKADVFYLINDEDEFYPREQYEGFVTKLGAYLPNFESKLYNSKHEIVQPMRDDIAAWLKRFSDK